MLTSCYATTVVMSFPKASNKEKLNRRDFSRSIAYSLDIKIIWIALARKEVNSVATGKSWQPSIVPRTFNNSGCLGRYGRTVTGLQKVKISKSILLLAHRHARMMRNV